MTDRDFSYPDPNTVMREAQRLRAETVRLFFARLWKTAASKPVAAGQKQPA